MLSFLCPPFTSLLLSCNISSHHSTRNAFSHITLSCLSSKAYRHFKQHLLKQKEKPSEGYSITLSLVRKKKQDKPDFPVTSHKAS